MWSASAVCTACGYDGTVGVVMTPSTQGDAGTKTDSDTLPAEAGSPPNPSGPAQMDAGTRIDATPQPDGASAEDAGLGVSCVDDGAESPCWFDDAWTYRTKVTLDSGRVSGDLPHFPVLLEAARDEWRTESRGGHVSHANGSDILFTLNDGTTRIDHELELYAGDSGRLVAWVEVPMLAASRDTVLYMYYGNAAAAIPSSTQQVWDDGGNDWFRAVWHMHQAGGENRLDATVFDNQCEPRGYEGDEGGPGKIAGGDTLDGKDDWLTCGTDASLEMQEQVTVSYWIRPASRLRKDEWFNGPWKGGYAPYLFGADDNLTTLGVYLQIGSEEFDRYEVGTADIPPSSWTHVAMTFDGTEIRGYVNGQLDFTIAEAGVISSTEGEPMTIGREEGDDGRVIHGSLDEVRVSRTARSADWIATSFRNQNTPGSFASFGAEMSRSGTF